jgi:hypothetical protein
MVADVVGDGVAGTVVEGVMLGEGDAVSVSVHVGLMDGVTMGVRVGVDVGECVGVGLCSGGWVAVAVSISLASAWEPFGKNMGPKIKMYPASNNLRAGSWMPAAWFILFPPLNRSCKVTIV